ncbi:MAG: hypothetical protein ACRDZ2_11435 [Ilumatobacteraceae bacterium]
MAREHGRWQHVTAFIRSRPDLDPADVLLAALTDHLDNGQSMLVKSMTCAADGGSGA